MSYAKPRGEQQCGLIGRIPQKAPIKELERTPEAVAVSGIHEAGGSLNRDPFLTSALSAFASESPKQTLGVQGAKPPHRVKPKARKEKRTTVAKMARRWGWMKGGGGYLDIVPYYFSGSKGTYDLKTKLEYCHHTWIKEGKGKAKRYRGIGCGERMVCPLCGSYRQMVLSREAAEAMDKAMDAVEVWGSVRPDSFGLKIILTIPISESKRIDDLLQSDYKAWQVEVGKLFKAAYAFVGECYGEGCGGVVGLHYTGEKALAKAHYHLNIYLFPARHAGKKWEGIKAWSNNLDDIRAAWTRRVNELFSSNIPVADLKLLYAGSVGQLHHWMRYLYKPPLSDLWKSWQGVEGGDVLYRVGRKGQDKMLSSGEVQSLADRLESIPAHFKRIRWFGIFSDGNRAKTMEDLLGLDSINMEDTEEEEDMKEKWQEEGEYLHFVRYVKDGVILRDGSGKEIKVPEKQIDYRPSKVSIGRRKRWRTPGGHDDVTLLITS